MASCQSTLTTSMSEEIVSHLEIISESFDRYFDTRNLEISEEWIINPYFDNLKNVPEDKEFK